MTLKADNREVRAGDNTPHEWEFVDTDGDPATVAGSTFVLRIIWAGGEIRKETGVDAELVMDGASSVLIWTPTVEETRLIPRGLIAKYEIERRSGLVQRVWVQGRIKGLAGSNDD